MCAVRGLVCRNADKRAGFGCGSRRIVDLRSTVIDRDVRSRPILQQQIGGESGFEDQPIIGGFGDRMTAVHIRKDQLPHSIVIRRIVERQVRLRMDHDRGIIVQRQRAVNRQHDILCNIKHALCQRHVSGPSEGCGVITLEIG